MTHQPPTTCRLTFTLLVALGCTSLIAAAVGPGPSHAGDDRAARDDSLLRQVAFKLTFANRDLVWLGDPASPGALVYVRPGARPIATDAHVTTLTKSHASPSRHYLHESRIAPGDDEHIVYAFTPQREKAVGTLDAAGRFRPNDFYTRHRALLPTWPADAALVKYDPQANALYLEVDLPGPLLTESLDFLPLDLVDTADQPLAGHFAIDYTPSTAATATGADSPGTVTLRVDTSGPSVALAQGSLPRVLRREEVELGSFDNAQGTYLLEAAYRPGAASDDATEPSVTFTFAGEFTSSVEATGPRLVVSALERPSTAPRHAAPPRNLGHPRGTAPPRITIDGRFDDWRNVAGVSDPRGDVVHYLEYVPDVDLLEFKVAHDNEHLYLYARVAGKVGWTHPSGGRSYFYAYIDVDQDAGTGFLPSRDDDCYFGVDVGDDCEVQFEFVDNTFRKTFYGFCGLSSDEDVLRQQVTVGPSHYGRVDERGRPRAHYKSEYIYRNGQTEITEDLKLGTSDTIHLAISPDGSEVEIVSTFTGFLKDRQGQPTLSIGQTIDLAAGMECDSKAYPGKTRWAADSTIAIRGYHLHPLDTADPRETGEPAGE